MAVTNVRIVLVIFMALALAGGCCCCCWSWLACGGDGVEWNGWMKLSDQLKPASICLWLPAAVQCQGGRPSALMSVGWPAGRTRQLGIGGPERPGAAKGQGHVLAQNVPRSAKQSIGIWPKYAAPDPRRTAAGRPSIDRSIDGSIEIVIDD